MQLFQFLLALTLFTFASAIPQSPVGSSGSGDSSSSNTGPGEAVGSAAAASASSSGEQEPLYPSVPSALNHKGMITDTQGVHEQSRPLPPLALAALAPKPAPRPPALPVPLPPKEPLRCCHQIGPSLEDWRLSLEELRCYKDSPVV